MAAADPTAHFTDMQWFMYHQRNVAFFGAFSAATFDDGQLFATARGLVALAPQLQSGFPAGIADDVLRQVVRRQSVPSLEGFPDRWLDRVEEIFEHPELPLFRVRYAAAPAGGFLLVQVAHALVEGADSALLSRSQSAEHQPAPAAAPTPPVVKMAATALGAVLAPLHMLAGNLVTLRPGPFRAATRVFPRPLFTALARRHGVRQRSVFYALVLATLFDSGTAAGKARISSTYSVIDEGGGADRDAFMRMRMRFAVFANAPDFGEFVRAVDARLTAAEAKESGFNAELNAGGIRVHRALSRLIPFAYTPRMFQFMPYDIVLGLIPPHRLGGQLAAGLVEPVYAGAALEGANACVIVPNRRLVSFNFYIQERLHPRLGTLDRLLGPPITFHSELLG